MYYEIYLDVIFMINFMLDFVIIKLTGSIIKRKSTLLRCALAAAISSALLCIVCLFYLEVLVEHYFIMMLIMDLAAVVMVFYRREEKIYKIIRIMAVYYIVSFILGGLLNLICANTVIGYYLFSIPWWKVVLAGGISLISIKPIIWCIDRRKELNNIYCTVELWFNGRMIRLNGFIDTGNHLKEPVSGKTVHVVELAAVEELLPKVFVDDIRAFYVSGVTGNGLYQTGIRMIPFRAVGTPDGRLLVALTADSMSVKNEVVKYTDKNVYIALYDGILAGDGSYRMLLNSKELKKERG